MWFTLSAMYLAVLQALDLFFILVAIRIFGFNPIEVSVFSTLWTLLFILGVRKAGYLTNKGLFNKAFRYAIVVVLLLAPTVTLTLTIYSKVLLYVSYLIHALSLSISRVTILSFMFEFFDYTVWRSVSVKLTVLTMFFEGLFLTLSSKLLDYGLLRIFISTLVLSTVMLIVLVVSIPMNILPLERRLFMIDRLLSKTLSNLSFAESTPLVLIREGGYVNEKTVSAKNICIALMGFVVSSEIYFTILPFILLNYVKLCLNDILLIYGLGKVLSSIIIYIFVKPIGRMGSFIVVTTRFLAITTSYFLLSNLHLTILVLSIIYFTGVLIDTALLNLYNEVTYGYGLAKYTGLKEFSSLIGSATCGFLYRALGLNVIPLGAFIMFIPFISIFTKKW